MGLLKQSYYLHLVLLKGHIHCRWINMFNIWKSWIAMWICPDLQGHVFLFLTYLILSYIFWCSGSWRLRAHCSQWYQYDRNFIAEVHVHMVTMASNIVWVVIFPPELMLKYICQWNNIDNCGLLVGMVGMSTLIEGLHVEGNPFSPFLSPAMAAHSILPFQRIQWQGYTFL